jgi:hypothetical protein
MDVYRLRSRVENDEVFLEFADSTDGAFKSFLDEDAFLGMNDLVITLLQFSVDIDVLNVQTSQMLEYLVLRPVFDILLTFLIFLSWHMLHFDLERLGYNLTCSYRSFIASANWRS